MTEYALLLSGVGIVAYSGYKTMGNAIKSLLTKADGQL
jgi:Flp pilus assembly pilin Flp